ncbi:hypothetical protein ON010_g10763 [Phytophthora cinnamomi]|nr:hypothetical protein ON010_g10763 [Phytophthora cinnamomi]
MTFLESHQNASRLELQVAFPHPPGGRVRVHTADRSDHRPRGCDYAPTVSVDTATCQRGPERGAHADRHCVLLLVYAPSPSLRVSSSTPLAVFSCLRCSVAALFCQSPRSFSTLFAEAQPDVRLSPPALSHAVAGPEKWLEHLAQWHLPQGSPERHHAPPPDSKLSSRKRGGRVPVIAPFPPREPAIDILGRWRHVALLYGVNAAAGASARGQTPQVPAARLRPAVQPQVHTRGAHEDPHGREAARVPRALVQQALQHVGQPVAPQAPARRHQAARVPRRGLLLHLPERQQARQAHAVPPRQPRARVHHRQLRQDLQHHGQPQPPREAPPPERDAASAAASAAQRAAADPPAAAAAPGSGPAGAIPRGHGLPVPEPSGRQPAHEARDGRGAAVFRPWCRPTTKPGAGDAVSAAVARRGDAARHSEPRYRRRAVLHLRRDGVRCCRPGEAAACSAASAAATEPAGRHGELPRRPHRAIRRTLYS